MRCAIATILAKFSTTAGRCSDQVASLATKPFAQRTHLDEGFSAYFPTSIY